MTAISVIGLGKLGAPMAAVLAAAGYRVMGADVRESVVAAVNQGAPPVMETGLDALMRQLDGGRLTATTSIREAVAETDLTFVVVATPSESDGGFSLDYALLAMREIGAALTDKDGYHTVVLTSTVMPGSTDGPIREALEQASGKRAGRDFGLCYSPEFIALGSVIHDLRHPDFLLIGESDRRAGDALLEIYRHICVNDPPAARMGFANAEIAKLAVNTFVTTKISYANMLAQVCARLPGADVDVVTAAIGLDTRIGTKYLKGGACYGGPCFPRDNRAFGALAEQVGADAWLARATDTQNEAQVAWVAREASSRLAAGERVAVLGLAYKTGTGIAEESHGIKIVRALAEDGFDVIAHDYEAAAHAGHLLATMSDPVRITSTLDRRLWGARLAVVTTPWQQYRPALEELLADPGGPTVIDCWRLIPPPFASPSYVRLGVGQPPAGVGALSVP